MELSRELHIADEVLESYSLNHLAPSEADAVEEHILVCEQCQIKLQEVDEFVAIVRRAAGNLEKRKPKLGAQGRWISPGLLRFATAGALAVAILAVGIAYKPLQRSETVVTLQAHRGADSTLFAT